MKVEAPDFVEQVNRFFGEVVFGFIFKDLDIAVRGRANYLAALGLVAYTEFMGGLVAGTLGESGKSRDRFYAFLDRMGAPYRKLKGRRELVKIYSDIRCGLAHEYFISKKSMVKMNVGDGHGDRCGIEVDDSGVVWFIVRKYLEDFRSAAKEYHSALTVERNEALLRKFRGAVGGKWHFERIVGGP